MQSPSLILLNFYCPDKSRGIFYSKTEICDQEVITEGTANATKRGVAENTFKEALEKFRYYAFKKFAARYKVSHP